MQVRAKHVEDLTFIAMGDTGHWVTMDNTQSFGGTDGGAKPMELVLMGLTGCTGMDVVAILKKMRVAFDRLEVTADADQAESHPRVFTRIRVDFKFFGAEIDAGKVHQAVELSSDKYCPVAAMLRPKVVVEHSVQINPSE